MIIPPLVQSVTEKLPDGMQKFDHSQVHVLATMDMIPSVYPRCTHGVPMVYPRCTHGVPTVYPQCTHGVPTVYPRCTHGVPTVYPQCTHGVPLHMFVLSPSTLGLIDSFPDFPTIQFLFTMYLQYTETERGWREEGGRGKGGVYCVTEIDVHLHVHGTTEWGRVGGERVSDQKSAFYTHILCLKQ